MSYHGDYAPTSSVVFNFNTASFADGSPITLGGTPALSVYKNSTTESTAGITLTVDYDSRTGMHHVVVDTSADGTFYAAGNDFDVVITTGTVGGTSVVGRVVGSFSLNNRSALRPATAGRTFAVDSSGGAPVSVGTGTGQINVVSGKVPATLASTDVTGNIAADLQTIKTQTVACPSSVTIGAFVGNATHAITVDSSGNVTFNNTSIATVTSVTSEVTANITHINSVATTSVTAVNANIGTAQPVNFSGIGATAYVKSDAEQINGQATSASGTVTFPNATLASTTNITAGTITTVTNLSNAPTNGDFTATMKTSITTAATAATPTAAAVTGTVGGIAGTTQTLDALQTALDSAHGAGSWATATGFATPTDVSNSTAAIEAYGALHWTTAVGFAVPGDAMALTTAERAAVADNVLRRQMVNIEGSAYGDALSLSSLYGIVQQLQESDTITHAGKLTVFKTNGITELGQTTLSTNADSEPVVGNKLT